LGCVFSGFFCLWSLFGHLFSGFLRGSFFAPDSPE